MRLKRYDQMTDRELVDSVLGSYNLQGIDPRLVEMAKRLDARLGRNRVPPMLLREQAM